MIHSSSSSISSSDEDIGDNDDVDQLTLFSSLIAQWAVSFNISQIALNELFKLLKRHNYFEAFKQLIHESF